MKIADYLPENANLPGNTSPGEDPRENPSFSVPGSCADDCPLCHGFGWVRFDREVGDPLFGKMSLCPNLLSSALGGDSGLNERELKLSWSAVSEINQAGAAVAAIKRTFERGRGWVYLWGQPGLGKTLILTVAIAEMIRSGRPGVYTRMADILDDLRKGFGDDQPKGEEQRRVDRWASLPLLAIDELDRVRSSEYSDEKRFALLDRRYQAALRGNSITLLASNRDPRGFDDYLSSRIFDGRFSVVKLAGADVRPIAEW